MSSEKNIDILKFNAFKNDCLKLVRDLESRLIEQLNIFNIDLSAKINNLNDKLILIQEENNIIKNSFETYKINQEKIKELDIFKSKADGNIISHEIRINNYHNWDKNKRGRKNFRGKRDIYK